MMRPLAEPPGCRYFSGGSNPSATKQGSIGMVRILVLLLGLGAVAALPACNTVKGAGQDISAGGQVISDSAEEVQEEIQ